MLETMSALVDAMLDPHRWNAVLDRVAALSGAAGAGYFILDKVSGRIEWASLSDTVPRTGFDPGSLGLAAILPMLRASHTEACPARQQQIPDAASRDGGWFQLPECPDAIGNAQWLLLHQDTQHAAVMVLLHTADASEPVADHALPLSLLESIAKSARLHLDVRMRDARQNMMVAALNTLPMAVLVVDRQLAIIETNPRATALLRRADALLTQDGRLHAPRSFETGHLERLVATVADGGSGSMGRMLLAHGKTAASYVVTALSLAVEDGDARSGLALLVVVDPAQHVPSVEDLRSCFGLSPAEARLAADLMAGRRLAEIASRHKVSIATLRSELRSTLRKTGATRQADLIRVLSGLAIAGRHEEQAG